MKKLLAHTLALFTSQIKEKHLECITRIDPGVPENLIGDEVRLRQVLMNLVGNAIKFSSDGGGVVLQVTRDSEGSRPDGTTEELIVHFVVADTGIGISTSQVERIFEPFTQADETISRKFGGTGLGLAISARLVEMMGGRIWVESKPAIGSAFHFTIMFRSKSENCCPSEPGIESAPDTPQILPIRILLVEDNRVNQALIVRLLNRKGAQVTVASSGAEALAIIENQPSSQFDVILMDISMPGMNGLQATKAIRSFEDLHGRRGKIIAMTAHAMEGDRERCLNSGMDDYISKPINPEELFRILSKCI